MLLCDFSACRKSCYRLILRLRYQSAILHSQSKLVHVYSLLYDDIYQPRSQSSLVISDVTSPVKLVGKESIALGSKLPLVTRIVRTGLGTRLDIYIVRTWRTGFRRVWYKY